jgi:hypothetical protein
MLTIIFSIIAFGQQPLILHSMRINAGPRQVLNLCFSSACLATAALALFDLRARGCRDVARCVPDLAGK